MEYADDGDVFQRICEYKNNKQYYKEKYIWKVVIQVVAGLKSLHELNILHRDMKSANIFLYKDTTAKLGDLNVSKVAKNGLLYTQTGTPYYASPEVWKDQPYDLKSDIWSLGCVTYEMCHLKPPFQADDMNGLFKRVLKGQFPPIPSHYSMDMRMLIKTLLQVSPQQRPNTEQILEMPIVIKRIKKYFPGREALFVPSLFDQPENGNDDAFAGARADSELLRTIKLQRNVFNLALPEPTYTQSMAGSNFQTIPGTQVLINRNSTKKGSLSPSKTKTGHGMVVTRTTAITNSQSMVNVHDGANNLNNVNVNLPQIGSSANHININNNGSIGANRNHLASVDDDYADDEYDERVPRKPKNLKHISDATRNRASNEGSHNRAGKHSVSGLPHQVSGRSRRSLEDVTGSSAYGGGAGGVSMEPHDGRKGIRNGSGLHQSPSVVSLQKRNPSKDSSLRQNQGGMGAHSDMGGHD